MKEAYAVRRTVPPSAEIQASIDMLLSRPVRRRCRFSKLFPKWHCKRLLRTDPLKALVIGGFVRGLSMRDVESL